LNNKKYVFKTIKGMVNTFLTHSDFVKSAQSLDRQRLGKQRVEAYQILLILENLDLLASIFSLPYNGSNLADWIKTIASIYKQLDYFYVVRDGVLYITPKISVKSDVLPTDRIIKLGFANHPAIRMWYGYQEALKYYINCHIDEWIKRGYKNTMKKYDIIGIPNMPSWVYSEDFHRVHRAALITKELQRREKPWYINNPLFIVEKDRFNDYIWPISDYDSV